MAKDVTHTLYTKHLIECDVLVAGGGAAGVPCALAAAREGAKVVLVQDRPVLGGNASSEVRMHIVGANFERPCQDLFLEARESGIIEEIRLENAFRNAQRSPSMFDFILYEKCRAEPNITLLLNTSVVGAAVENAVIQNISAIRPSTEDEFCISAKVFIDCTGDGGLGAATGAAFTKGREDREAYGEPLAQESADEKTLGSTLLLMARKHDRPMPFIAPPWARRFTEDDLKLRPHATAEVDSGLEYGFWWMEWGGQFDTIKDNELIRDELLAIVMGVWDHIKNSGDHGAEYWALDWFGALPGKRESRRFIGQYVLTEHDILKSKPQFDSIAYGGWPIDLHPPEGVDLPQEPPTKATEVPWLYDIPLRSCIARDLKNLMFAGRNLSATHVAFASTRVMATCATIGQGVGIASAYAAARDIRPADLCCQKDRVGEIRQQILRRDIFLIGESYQGRSDLIMEADIRASSETSGGEALNVRSGFTRTVQGDRGVLPDRESKGFHRWVSDPQQGLPAWIEMRWSRDICWREIDLVFDTGLHRHLTLSQSDAYYRKMYWGTGQPECVRAYRIEIEVEGRWRELISETNNWQRLRNCRVEDDQTCRAIRILIDETWGHESARIARIGVYA